MSPQDENEGLPKGSVGIYFGPGAEDNKVIGGDIRGMAAGVVHHGKRNELHGVSIERSDDSAPLAPAPQSAQREKWHDSALGKVVIGLLVGVLVFLATWAIQLAIQ